MIKYILFDFDGTLINTNDIIKTLLKESIKTYVNKEVDDADLVAIYGRPLIDQMKHFSEEKHNDMVEYYRNQYRLREEEETKIFNGIEELIKTLHESEYRIAIVSNKSSRGIQKGLKMFKLEKYIEYFVSADMVTNRKPHPECIDKTAEFFDCKYDEMIIIGDTPHDIEAGIRAGIKTVLVDWTIMPKEVFKNAIPDFTISTPNELLKILEELNMGEEAV